MMVTTIRIDACADHMNKKPDLIIKKHKIITSEKYHSQNLTWDVQMSARHNNSLGNCCKV